MTKEKEWGGAIVPEFSAGGRGPTDELIGYAEHLTTPCQKMPWKCQPRPVRMVLWDADDTMWHIEPHGTIASSVLGPFVLVDPDTVEAGCGPAKTKAKETKGKPVTRILNEKTGKWEWFDKLTEEEQERWWEEQEAEEIEAELMSSLTPEEKKGLEKLSKVTGKQLALVPIKKEEKKPGKATGCRPVVIKLLPTMRRTLDELTARKIPMAVISLNTPGSVKDIVEAFGLTDRFVEIRDSWKNKADVFEEITQKNKISPCQTIFVDNMVVHVSDVSKKCGLGLVIGQERDIVQPIEVLKFIEK